jgi:hypothetical protein
LAGTRVGLLLAGVLVLIGIVRVGHSHLHLSKSDISDFALRVLG